MDLGYRSVSAYSKRFASLPLLEMEREYVTPVPFLFYNKTYKRMSFWSEISIVTTVLQWHSTANGRNLSRCIEYFLREAGLKTPNFTNYELINALPTQKFCNFFKANFSAWISHKGPKMSTSTEFSSNMMHSQHIVVSWPFDFSPQNAVFNR